MSRRRAVKSCVEEGLGRAAQVCRALGLARSSYYRGSAVSAATLEKKRQIAELSERRPRYGYRRITALLSRAGMTINGKRVQRVRRAEGLQVSRKQRADKAAGALEGRSASERPRTTRYGAGTLWKTRPRTGAGFGC
jgi:hypothetical protein